MATFIGGGGAGDVAGPASATDNGVARFDGTTGKILQDSSVTIDDAGILVAIATGAVKHRLGNFTFGGTGSSLNRIQTISGGSISINNGNTMFFVSDEADGATAVMFDFNQTAGSGMTTAGSLVMQVRNNSVVVFSVDKDGDALIAGDLDHDGAGVGFYGTAPAAQAAAYTRNATIVEDRTLLASASATATNNNNVLAALVADLQAIGILG